MANFVTVAVSQMNDLEAMVARREVRFGGIVTDAVSGISQKSGKPYGSITIEDYSGSYTLRLFGEDCLKYRSFCEKGIFVFVQAEVTQLTYRKDGIDTKMPPRIRINKIMLLGDVVNAFTKSVNFHIRINDVTDDFCNRLKKIAGQNRGEAQLTVNVDDAENNQTLFMSSGKMKIDPTNFIPLLEKMPEVVKISLNNK